MPQDEAARSPEASQERMVLPSHMHIQLQLPTTPKLSTLFLSTPSSHFPKDFLGAVSISDNKTEAEGQLAVKRQVKELYPGAHFPVGSFSACGGTFLTTFSPYTLGAASAFCKLTCTLWLYYFGTSLPLFFAVPISRSP